MMYGFWIIIISSMATKSVIQISGFVHHLKCFKILPKSAINKSFNCLHIP